MRLSTMNSVRHSKSMRASAFPLSRIAIIGSYQPKRGGGGCLFGWLFFHPTGHPLRNFL